MTSLFAPGHFCRAVRAFALILVVLAFGTAPAQRRTTVRVSPCPAAAQQDSDADDTDCIQTAIDHSTPGAVIDFGSGRFHIKRTLKLKANRTYTGSATIQMDARTAPGSPVAIVDASESNDLAIEGLDLDGSGVGGILLLTVNGSAVPARNIVIRRNTFRNSNPKPWHSAQAALYLPVGAERSIISENAFVHVGDGLSLGNLDRCEIRANTFDGVLQGNAISVIFSKAPFPRGSGVTISGNTGRNLARMAIEVFHNGGEPPSHIAIEDNRFSDWTPQARRGDDAFGISVVAGDRHRVAGNVLSGNGPYGIELGAPDTVVTGNVITGFGTGIVVQNGRSSVVSGNRILNSSLDGIGISNASPEPDVQIVNNYIENAKRAGIGGSPTDYGGALIAGNRIVRAAGFYPDDSRVTFYGIQVQPGCTRPVQFRDNVILQTAADPPAGFTFYGFGLFGRHAGNYYGGNRVESRSRRPLGAAFFSQGVPLLDGNTVENNVFVSLSRVAAGVRTNATTSRNNIACGVQDTDTPLVTARPKVCPVMPK
jgi:nitrous oxidase accessory protein NosD